MVATVSRNCHRGSFVTVSSCNFATACCQKNCRGQYGRTWGPLPECQPERSVGILGGKLVDVDSRFGRLRRLMALRRFGNKLLHNFPHQAVPALDLAYCGGCAPNPSDSGNALPKSVARRSMTLAPNLTALPLDDFQADLPIEQNQFSINGESRSGLSRADSLLDFSKQFS